MSEADRAWVDRTVEAWQFTSREITGVERVPNFRAVFFDAGCVLESDNALSSTTSAGVTWKATPHGGKVTLPNGDEMPVGVISATIGEEAMTFFTMSTPSVWRAAGLDRGGHRGGPVSLEDTMVAVMLHEGSHVAQSKHYGIGALIEKYKLPDSFNDDSMQKRFKDNQELAASVARETELFLAAAAAADLAEAKRLAREARELMRARQARWFVGDDAYWVEAEDIWLTFEGSGQWAGYQWLTHPRGGRVPVAEAMPGFVRGGGWWSQSEGFALAMALDRIGGPGWKKHAFGDGAHTLLAMLDTALRD